MQGTSAVGHDAQLHCFVRFTFTQNVFSLTRVIGVDVRGLAVNRRVEYYFGPAASRPQPTQASQILLRLMLHSTETAKGRLGMMNEERKKVAEAKDWSRRRRDRHSETDLGTALVIFEMDLQSIDIAVIAFCFIVRGPASYK